MPRGLDTYFGRRITRIEKDSDGNWFVELEGEVRIINVDRRRKLPKGLPDNGKGLIFTNMTLEQDRTTMIFKDSVPDGNEWRITFSPVSYQILDNTVAETAYAPQAGGYGKAIEVPEVERPEE